MLLESSFCVPSGVPCYNSCHLCFLAGPDYGCGNVCFFRRSLMRGLRLRRLVEALTDLFFLLLPIREDYYLTFRASETFKIHFGDAKSDSLPMSRSRAPVTGTPKYVNWTRSWKRSYGSLLHLRTAYRTVLRQFSQAGSSFLILFSYICNNYSIYPLFVSQQQEGSENVLIIGYQLYVSDTSR